MRGCQGGGPLMSLFGEVVKCNDLPYSETDPLALTKRHKELLKVCLFFRCTQPPLWSELVWVDKDGRIQVNGTWSHADGCLDSRPVSSYREALWLRITLHVQKIC